MKTTKKLTQLQLSCKLEKIQCIEEWKVCIYEAKLALDLGNLNLLFTVVKVWRPKSFF